jgi:serine/threonine protein kinase
MNLLMNDLTGKTLDSYYVQSLVGSGGMADVYKVWDRERGTLLAMKVLKPELADNQYLVQLFQSEGKILSELQHPNIVRYYGSYQNRHLFYFIMDYVEGTTLKDELKPGTTQAIGRILEVLSPICTALGYAHQKGVIHCDIKPANILIHKNGAVLLSDFGIARLVNEVEDLATIAGTPQYMAPEQVKGYEPTPQTDIYALGVILYEMITGRRPYTGEQAPFSGNLIDRVLWEKVNLDPDPIIPQNKMISRELEDLILGCLEIDSVRRPCSVLDFLPQLQQAVFHLKSSEKISNLCPTCGRNLPFELKDCSYCKSGGSIKILQGQSIVLGILKSLRNRIWIFAMITLGILILVLIIKNSSTTTPFMNTPNNQYTNIMATVIPVSSTDKVFLYIPPGAQISKPIYVSLCNWVGTDTSLDIFIKRPDGSQKNQMNPGSFSKFDCGTGVLPGYQFYIKPETGEQPGAWEVSVTGDPSGLNATINFQVFP